MSIILDALKKTPKKEINKEVDVKADTKKSAQSNVSNLNVPALIAVAIILGLILLIYPKPKTKAPDTVISPSQKLTAEGYSPPAPPAPPKQESTAVSIFKPKTISSRLTLNGIVYGMGKPTAIIENRILEEGQSIKGSKVVKIHQDKVELLNELTGETFVLKLR